MQRTREGRTRCWDLKLFQKNFGNVAQERELSLGSCNELSESPLGCIYKLYVKFEHFLPSPLWSLLAPTKGHLGVSLQDSWQSTWSPCLHSGPFHVPHRKQSYLFKNAINSCGFFPFLEQTLNLDSIINLPNTWDSSLTSTPTLWPPPPHPGPHFWHTNTPSSFLH